MSQRLEVAARPRHLRPRHAHGRHHRRPGQRPTPGNYLNNPNRFVGMAPGSRIVSIKLADAHGQTDVSQVVAGIAGSSTTRTTPA